MSYAHAAQSEPLVLGSVTPRIFTPPLVTGPPGPCGCGCALTEDTSEGFDWVEFARDSLRRPPYPWQRWTAIHGGELLPDGRPRFRYVWVIVGRQNGKTEIPVMLSGYWMFVASVPLILGTSTQLDYAKESWSKLVKLIRKSPDPSVQRRLPVRKWTRETNGQHECWCYANDNEDPDEVSRYKIAASNEEGGRSLTVHRGVCDEVRQHHDYSAMGAVESAMENVPDAQLWLPSNMGSDKSVVLNDARAEAMEFIRTGEGDPRTAWFEYSAPEGSRADDPRALAAANPQFNRTMDGENMVRQGAKAMRTGGDKLRKFQTETMCMSVHNLKPAYDEFKWKDCNVPGDLAGVRNRVAVLFDVSPDNQHATLVAAAVLPDGRCRVEAVAAWSGDDMARLVSELKTAVGRIKPRAFGWLPGGPAAAYGAELRPKGSDKRPDWLPAGCKMETIRGELPDVCMGLDEQINKLAIVHSDDPLINAHVLGAERLPWGDRWVLSRKGGHCDAAYATAGAVYLARMLPAPLGKPRLIVVGDDED
jgi:hypothetical protein